MKLWEVSLHGILSIVDDVMSSIVKSWTVIKKFYKKVKTLYQIKKNLHNTETVGIFDTDSDAWNLIRC